MCARVQRLVSPRENQLRSLEAQFWTMICVLVLTAQPSLPGLPGCSLLHECGQLNALNSGKHPAHEISKGSFERKRSRMSSRTRVLLVVLLHSGDTRRG